MNKWIIWSINVLIIAGYAVAYKLGAVAYLLHTDKTYITLGIAGLLLLVASVASMITLTNSYNERVLEQLHYVVDHFPVLGMLGTTVALYLVVFEGVPSQEVMLMSMSLALTTTIAGLISSMIGTQLMLQVERAHEEKDN